MRAARADAPTTRRRRPAATRCAAGRDARHAAGAGSTSPRALAGDAPAAAGAGPLEPNDDAGPSARRALGPARARSRRRSTTGTTRPTSTASTLRQGQRLRRRLLGPAQRLDARAALAARHAARRRACSPGSASTSASAAGRRAARVAPALAYRAPAAAAGTTSQVEGSPAAGVGAQYTLRLAESSARYWSRAAPRRAPRGARAPGCRRRASRGGTSLRHDRARADERLLADLDPRAEDGAAADARAAPDRRALDQLVALLGAAHEVVVRRHDARRDEDVLLERRVRGDVRVGLDLRQRADRRVVLDQRAAADDDVVADRARARARRPGRRRSRARRCVVPAKTTAPVETIVPSPSSSGGSGSRFAVERGESVGCLPTTASSQHLARPRRAPCPGRRPRSRATCTLGAHAGRAPSESCSCSSARTTTARRARPRAVALAAHEAQEVLALEPQRLVVRDLRAEDVAGARLPLAVGRRRASTAPSRRSSPCARAPCRRRRPSSRVPTTVILRILCGSSHERCMCAILPGREAQVAEDDVLDARGEEVALPCATASLGSSSEQVEDHREVVHAERPERVLVRADDAEVLAVAVDAEHVAELAASRPAPSASARRGGRAAGGRASARGRARSASVDELVHLRARASRAASRRRRACRPRAPAARARSASAPASRSRPRRAPSSASSSSKSPVTRASPGSARAKRSRICVRGVAEPAPGRRARRSCGRGSGPSSRARPRDGRCASQLPDLAVDAPCPSVAFRKSTTSGASSTSCA